MNTSTDLNAQIAQRLFGWRRETVNPIWEETWRDARNDYASEVPAYTTDPVATALVWAWLWGQPQIVSVELRRPFGTDYGCLVTWKPHGSPVPDAFMAQYGATWQEALCRAALALAEDV